MRRITPLNILTAFLLIWASLGVIDQTIGWGSVAWILLLTVVVVVGDQVFRVLLGNLKRIWVLQLLFLVVVGLVALVIWQWKI